MKKEKAKSKDPKYTTLQLMQMRLSQLRSLVKELEAHENNLAAKEMILQDIVQDAEFMQRNAREILAGSERTLMGL